MLRQCALELFIEGGTSALISFRTKAIRDHIYKLILRYISMGVEQNVKIIMRLQLSTVVFQTTPPGWSSETNSVIYEENDGGVAKA